MKLIDPDMIWLLEYKIRSRQVEELNQRVTDEEKTEKEVQASGANENRLDPSSIDAAIGSTQYWNPVGSTLTVCCLVLKNGYTVVGESAAADLPNFNRALGRRIAYENARRKIWPLESYLLKQKLYTAQERAGARVVEVRTESPGGYSSETKA
jgi:hypothetical protein